MDTPVESARVGVCSAYPRPYRRLRMLPCTLNAAVAAMTRLPDDTPLLSHMSCSMSPVETPKLLRALDDSDHATDSGSYPAGTRR